jgi:hypothetical protein
MVLGLAKHPEGALLTLTCAECRSSTARFLKVAGACHDPNYFQCLTCGRIWTEQKTESSLPLKATSLIAGYYFFEIKRAG